MGPVLGDLLISFGHWEWYGIMLVCEIYLLAAARRALSERQPQSKKGGWVGGDRWRAPARPKNGGVPSTARPSHLGGRASGTRRNTDRKLLAKCPGDKRNLQRGAVKPPSANPPPSPFSSY